jgi:hypothetical protein
LAAARLRQDLLSHLRRKETLAWAFVLTATAAVLCFLPLFGLLAYEFSAMMALCGSLAAAHLGSLHGRHLSDRPLARVYLAATAAHLLLLVPPLLLVTLNALRVRNCDYLQGLAFYALLPGGSVICATAAGVLSAHFVRRPAIAAAAALLVVVLSVGLALLRLYLDPPVYAYDPFVGYFPGALYDEDVTVPGALVWFRVMNAAVVASFLLVAAQRPLLALSAAVAGAALYSQGPRLGFRNTAPGIERALGGRYETEHFVILYRDDGRARDLLAMAKDHEFRYAQLAATLGVRPRRKVRSYLFPSAAEKRRLLGAGRTFVAKPWLDEIYLQEGDPPQPALKHELAHVFGGALAGGALGLPRTLDLGLIEGLAVALEWPSDEGLDPHQQVRALRDEGLLPPIDSVFGRGFLGHAPARAYTVAGSFVRYLLDRYGAAPLRFAYASGDLHAAYGRPLADLEAAWRTTIAAATLSDSDRAVMRERFRRPAIWHRTCAHEVAALLRRADELRATRPGGAADLLARVVDFDPGDPAHLLDLADALLDAGAADRARDAAGRALVHPSLSAPLRQRALTTMGDIEWRAGRVEAAAAAYARAAREPAGEAERRLTTLKARAAASPPAVERALREFLLGDDSRKRDPFTDGVLLARLEAETTGDGLGPYLLGRQLLQRGRFAPAAEELGRACALPLPGADFERECQRLLALSSWRARDGRTAQGAATRLLSPREQGGDPAFARDLLDRLAWERNRSLPAGT